MKKFFMIILPIFLIFMSGCGESENISAEDKKIPTENISVEKKSAEKILIAYFSRAGENYLDVQKILSQKFINRVTATFFKKSVKISDSFQ